MKCHSGSYSYIIIMANEKAVVYKSSCSQPCLILLSTESY